MLSTPLQYLGPGLSFPCSLLVFLSLSLFLSRPSTYRGLRLWPAISCLASSENVDPCPFLSACLIYMAGRIKAPLYLTKPMMMSACYWLSQVWMTEQRMGVGWNLLQRRWPARHKWAPVCAYVCVCVVCGGWLGSCSPCFRRHNLSQLLHTSYSLQSAFLSAHPPHSSLIVLRRWMDPICVQKQKMKKRYKAVGEDRKGDRQLKGQHVYRCFRSNDLVYKVRLFVRCLIIGLSKCTRFSFHFKCQSTLEHLTFNSIRSNVIHQHVPKYRSRQQCFTARILL